MKKAFTFLILLAFLPFYSAAQQWAAPGTEWNFIQRIIFHGDIPTTVKVVDEYLIDNILVSELEVENQLGCGVVGSVIQTYSTPDGKVYFKEPSDAEFKILYDFQAEVGESWTIPFTYGQYDELVTYTVEEISIVDVQGSPRRQLHCNVSFEIGILESPLEALIVDGVGDLHYLFPWQSAVCDEGFIIALCSYVDEEIGTYRPNPNIECVTVGIHEEADFNFFEVSPNPVSNILTISVPETTTSNVPFTIFDMQGKVVHQGQLNSNTVFNLSVSEWTTGLYFIRSNLGDKIQVSKFMKK